MARPRPNGRRVVVAGCGRLGALLASRLSGRGMDVVVIDVDERSFEGLSPEYSGFRIVGDATEAAVLRQAGVGTSSAVVAATPDDSVNLMIAQVAKLVLGADRVVARVSDPARRAVYHGLEIETVCPATLAVDAVAAYLTMMPADAVEEAP